MLPCGRSPTDDEVSLTVAPPARRQLLGVGLIPPEKSARGAGEPAKKLEFARFKDIQLAYLHKQKSCLPPLVEGGITLMPTICTESALEDLPDAICNIF